MLEKGPIFCHTNMIIMHRNGIDISGIFRIYYGSNLKYHIFVIYSGADLAALVREASVNALREFMSTGQSEETSIIVSNRHFEAAFKKVKPSVSVKDQKVYNRIKERVGLT